MFISQSKQGELKQAFHPLRSLPLRDTMLLKVRLPETLMTKVVFNLWYEREYPDREDTELHIGIYSSEAEARAAIARLSDKPGFRDYPEGFNIYPYTLDKDGWTEGYVSIRESQMIAEGYEPYEDKEENRHFPPITPLE